MRRKLTALTLLALFISGCSFMDVKTEVEKIDPDYKGKRTEAAKIEVFEGEASTRPFREIATIRVTGRPAHGAMPHAAVDPIVAAAEIVLALQTLISRRTDPTRGAVVSVCKVDAGSAFNVIPETAELRGTMRALGEKARGRLMAGLKRIATSVARAHGAAAEVKFRPGYPPVVNPRRRLNTHAPMLRRWTQRSARPTSSST